MHTKVVTMFQVMQGGGSEQRNASSMPQSISTTPKQVGVRYVSFESTLHDEADWGSVVEPQYENVCTIVICFRTSVAAK